MDDDEFEKDEVIRERQRETINFAAQDSAAHATTGEKDFSGNGAVNAQPRALRSMDHRRNPSVNTPST